MSTFSYSKISCFEQCQQRYKYRYVDKIPTEGVVGIEAIMGDCVHHAFEKLYSPLVDATWQENSIYQENMFENIQGDNEKIMSLEKLLEVFEAKWDYEFDKAEMKNTTIMVREDGDVDKYFNIGLNILNGYYKKYYPFNDEKTLGVELSVEMDLNNDGQYMINGIIDRITRIDKGEYRIIDYKTFTKLPSKNKLVDMTQQLEIYEFAIRDMFPDAEKIHLTWNLLYFDEDVIMTKNLKNKIDESYLEKLKNKLLTQIDFIKETDEKKNYKTNVTRLCDWCDYKSICPAWVGK